MIKKIIIGIIGLFIVIGVIGAIAGSGKKETSTTPATSPSSNQPTQSIQKQEETTAKVGEPVEDSKLAFTVISIDTAGSLGNQFTRRDAQGVFYVITLKIENKSDSTKTIDSSMLTLVDSQNRKFDRSIEAQIAKGLSQGKVDLFLQQVQPGLSVTGDIVFDLPKDVTGLRLVVKGALFSGGKKIDLGK